MLIERRLSLRRLQDVCAFEADDVSHVHTYSSIWRQPYNGAPISSG